jgi:hexokinase
LAFLLCFEINLRTGGTNLRVCLVTLHGKGKFEIAQTKYRLTEEQKQEDGQKLFDFCAECLKIFLEANVGEGGDKLIKPGQELPLGFTVGTIIL